MTSPGDIGDEAGEADEGGATHAQVEPAAPADDGSSVSKSTASSQSEWCVVKDGGGSGSGSGSASVGEADASESGKEAEGPENASMDEGSASVGGSHSATHKINESDEDWGDEDE